MWEKLKSKLTSRKFLAYLLVGLWWLIGGTVNGTLEELGWKIVALTLGYIGVEGAVDLIAFFREKKGK